MDSLPEFVTEPLSPLQRQFWFMESLYPGARDHILNMVLAWRGELDVSILMQAIRRAADSHPSLRTRFVDSGGMVSRRIDATAAAEVSFEEGDPVGYTRLALELPPLVQDSVSTAFDLERGPVFRARIYRLDARTHAIVLAMHHIVSDGWSVGIIARDIVRQYQSLRNGGPSVSAPDGRGTERRCSNAAVPAENIPRAKLEYWLTMLAGAPWRLELPTKSRPQIHRGLGRTHAHFLSAELVAAVYTLTSVTGASTFAVCVAAAFIFLARISGQDDVVVGVPLANRSSREVADVVGLFVNAMPMRITLENSWRFIDVLARTRTTLFRALMHQDVPFEQLVRELNPPRRPGMHSIFQVTLNHADFRQPPCAGDDFTLEMWPGLNGGATFDLDLHFVESPLGLGLLINYNSELFEAATIERWARHFDVLLGAVAVAPQAPLTSLSLFTDQELAAVAAGPSAERGVTTDDCLHRMFERQVAVTPSLPAVITLEETLTYRELDTRANRIAERLSAAGAGPESLIGMCVPRDSSCLIALLGILKAGAAYVPLDPAYPQARLALILSDCKPLAVVVDTRAGVAATVIGAAGWQGPTIFVDETGSTVSPPDGEPALAVTPANLAYCLYTSGSTGTPKGVMVEHGNVVSFTKWMTDTFSAADLRSVLLATSINFDVSIAEIFPALATGGAVVIAQNIIDFAERARLFPPVTLINTVPSAIPALLDSGALAGYHGVLNVAGEALSRGLAKRIHETLPGIRLNNCYGPTEATVYASRAIIAHEPSVPITLGRPVANTSIYVLDEHMRPVPFGASGELYIGGAQVARGYLGRLALTSERFVRRPFGGEHPGRLYRTGDIGRLLAQGEIEYVGRRDFQIKLRGYRIELGEIESALLSHGRVAEAVVIAREDDRADKQLIAFVVPSGTASAPRPDGVSGPINFEVDLVFAAELREHLIARLPAVMIPAAFITLSHLPHAPNGKLDRTALHATGQLPSSAAVAPQRRLSATEEALAGIWLSELRIESLGHGDDFFARGGHSLLATQVALRVRHHFNVEFTVRDLFEAPNLEACARRVEQLQLEPRGSEPAIRRVARVRTRVERQRDDSNTWEAN